jgi:hypothetical protein
MKTQLTTLVAVGLLAAAGHAATLVYEGFDYTPGSDVNTPLNGGMGFLANSSWTPGQQGGVITVYDAASAVGVTNSNAGGEIEWDGVVDNLPTSPASTANRYIGTSPTTVSGTDRITAQRVLSQSAGALAGADNILWASIVWHQQGSNYGRHVGFALGTDDLANRSVNIDSGGDGIGVGGAYNTYAVTPTIWTGGNVAARTTTGAANVSASEDNIVILKFEFGAADTVTAYRFLESETLSEATFNANAVSASSAIDETTINVLSFSQSRGQEAIDEIRLGDTFADVIATNIVPEPASLATGLLGLTMLVVRRRR